MNLTIKQKFIAAGAFILISIVSILLINQLTISNIKKYDAVQLAIIKVQANMLMLRRNEKDFLARNALKDKGKFDKNFLVIEKVLLNLNKVRLN